MNLGPHANKASHLALFLIEPPPQAPLCVVLGSVHVYTENHLYNEKNSHLQQRLCMELVVLKEWGFFKGH